MQVVTILGLCGVGGGMYCVVEHVDIYRGIRERIRQQAPHMGSMADYIRHTDLDDREIRVINKFAYTYNQWAHAEPDVLMNALHLGGQGIDLLPGEPTKSVVQGRSAHWRTYPIGCSNNRPTYWTNTSPCSTTSFT